MHTSISIDVPRKQTDQTSWRCSASSSHTYMYIYIHAHTYVYYIYIWCIQDDAYEYMRIWTYQGSNRQHVLALLRFVVRLRMVFVRLDCLCDRDVTHSYMMTWHIHLCDKTHSYMWHAAFIQVMWLIHICVAFSGTFANSDCAPWLPVWEGRDEFIHVTWFIKVGLYVYIFYSCFPIICMYACVGVFLEGGRKGARATHYNTLQHTRTYRKEGERKGGWATHTATHTAEDRGREAGRADGQHTATHCNTLQHIATHCNTLQHTATQ